MVNLLITYLDVPLGANPKSNSIWKPVLDRISKRLVAWKARLLSRAGRLVLIKSILNSIPLYYLSLFKIPKGIVDKIISMQRHFFWCNHVNKKGLPLVKWELIQKLNSVGGLELGTYSLKMLLCCLSGGGGSPMKGIPYGGEWCALTMGVT